MKRYNENKQKALEQIIQNQQDEIESLRTDNRVLQAESQGFSCDLMEKEILIDEITKESNQYALTAKYIAHIFLIMDALEKVLKDNCTMGKVVRKALLEFKKTLNVEMMQLSFDGNNLFYDPNKNTNINTNEKI